jgi:hypothetical protein
METVDYFVLIMVVVAYLGWILGRDNVSESPDSHT